MKVDASDVAVHLLLGLRPGAVYAALGLGLVAMHRGTGILNLSFGAMAMYPAYVYAALRSSGDLVLPGLPGTHHLAERVPTLPAMAIAAAASVVLGLLSYALVFGPLRAAPPLASIVAAVGLLLTLQSVVVLRFGGDPRLVDPVLPRHHLTAAGTTIPSDGLYLTGLVALLAVGSSLFYRRTRFGLASRAATEDRTSAEMLGWSSMQLGIVNWVLGALVAGVFGILLAPIAGLTTNGYSLLVVPSLVAALAGRMTSLAWTLAGGLALGMTQSVATLVRLPWEWTSPQVIKEVVPVLALALVVLVFGTPLPGRGVPAGTRLPPARLGGHPVVMGAIILAVGAATGLVATGRYRSAVVVSLIGILLCLSVVILTGFAGQVSLAQMSFAGVAAIVLSRVATDWHVPFPLGALVGATAAAGASALVGAATSRSRGETVAIVSLGAALVIEELLWRRLSLGLLGPNLIDAPRPFGIDLGPIGSDGKPRAAFVLLVGGIVAAATIGVSALRRSRLGGQMLAVRANERAAAAAGVNVRRTRVTAWALSGFVAGVGGVLLGYHQTAVSGQSFSLSRSLLLLAVTYIGGVAGVFGAVVGGLILPGGILSTAWDRALDLGPHSTLFSGLALTVIVVRSSSRRQAGAETSMRRSSATKGTSA